jgi:hypothetical protein
MTQEILDVGWAEWIAIPELDIPYIAAKIDTGARTSCLHTFCVEPFKKDGENWLRFGLHPIKGNSEVEVWRELKALEQRNVTDSGGHTEERWVVEVDLAIGGNTYRAEMTLTNRDNMAYRMLLGRTAMKDAIRVNPGGKWLCGQPKLADREQSHQVFVQEDP